MVFRVSHISLISIDDPNLVPEISSPVGANLVAHHVETPLILELQSPVQRQYCGVCLYGSQHDVAMYTRISARDLDAIDTGLVSTNPPRSRIERRTKVAPTP